MKKLEILVPQYKETEEVIKPLLDSIAIQQNVNFDEIGVIIVNDGTDVHLSREFLDKYPFEIQYILNQHKGVSGTRDCAFQHATAEYVMWCDADDMFFNACGLWIIFNEMENGEFDNLTSIFVEEGRSPEGKVFYINREMDSTFVHGKVHRRQYLIDNDIRWNEALTIHEDSFFNILSQKLARPDKFKYCPAPFYLWKWRNESVCRRDPKYILKTYNNMLDSSTALIREFLKRKSMDNARFYATSMIYDAYFTMNKDEWINQDNKEYRDNTEKRFKKFYNDFKDLFEGTDENIKKQIIAGIKNRMFQEGLFLESVTFETWIKHIESL